MLDVKFIRENKALITKNNRARQVEVDLDLLLQLDSERQELQHKIEELRAQRNRGSKSKPSPDEIVAMREVGEQIMALEPLAKEKEMAFFELAYKLPNLSHEDAPVGETDEGNKIMYEHGEKTIFNFKPKEHFEIGAERDLIDLPRATAVSGTRFAYLKGGLVMLEFALVQHVLRTVTNQQILQQIIADKNLSILPTPFVPVVPPVFIKPEVMAKMGRLEPKEERYYIPSDDLYLIGSAEHTLGPMHMDSTFDEAELPVRYLGFSTAFRREAGSYGKDTKGIFRVHQFDKLEMESFCLSENAEQEQELFIGVQEYLMRSLGIPYRLVLKCTGDMGLPDYREYDVEAWLPGQGAYRETHTADLMTDYQARRLNIRVKRQKGTEFAHMNDATALAIGRTLIAIMENFQQADGTIVVPEVLHPFTGTTFI